MSTKEPTNIMGYDGVCPVCGSKDGMIVHASKGDGKYRNMCRVMGCPAFYMPSPIVGFDTVEDCRNPFESALFKAGPMTVGQYCRHGHPENKEVSDR